MVPSDVGAASPRRRRSTHALTPRQGALAPPRSGGPCTPPRTWPSRPRPAGRGRRRTPGMNQSSARSGQQWIKGGPTGFESSGLIPYHRSHLNTPTVQPPAHGPHGVAHERPGGRDAEGAQRRDLIARRHRKPAGNGCKFLMTANPCPYLKSKQLS